jgi:UDPglucose--hexose-1-phosphate uridylyltransferase
MPELRKDPVIGRWVIIASERARRPGNFIDTNDDLVEDEDKECAFCNYQGETISPGSPSKDVRVVLSPDTVTGSQAEFHRSTKGLYDVINGVGAHEIVIETREHIANMADLEVNQISAIFQTYAIRMRELEKDQRFQYVLAYKNYGPTAGSREIGHTRSHIVTTPVNPLRVKEKLIGAKKYFDANKTCVYCDLIRQEVKSQQRIVCLTEHFIAVIPFAARFLFEIRIIPKNHHCDFHVGIKGVEEDLAKMMKTVLQKLQQGLDDPAYNFVIQTAPFYRSSADAARWKTIQHDYHWHIELMPRLVHVAGFEKGTGFYICAVPPENMAEYLRGVHLP